ncbi:MAG: hypothetical protein ABUL77_01100 [Bacteroidota bacterium]
MRHRRKTTPHIPRRRGDLYSGALMLPPRVCLPDPRPSPFRSGVRGWARALWTAPTNVVGHLAGLLVSGGRPTHVRGPAAGAWLYPIRPGRGLSWVAAVTLGHVILYRPGMFDGRLGRLVLAHELAHTRQHDWLGPFYLPLHVLAQATSALLSIGAGPQHSRVHDNNPLEQTFICLGASAYGPLARGEHVTGAPANCDGDTMLAAFGLDDEPPLAPSCG